MLFLIAVYGKVHYEEDRGGDIKVNGGGGGRRGGGGTAPLALLGVGQPSPLPLIPAALSVHRQPGIQCIDAQGYNIHKLPNCGPPQVREAGRVR